MKPLLALDKDEFDEGTVHVSDEFTMMDSLQQADLLQDYRAKLDDMYDRIVSGGEFLHDLAPSRFKVMN